MQTRLWWRARARHSLATRRSLCMMAPAAGGGAPLAASSSGCATPVACSSQQQPPLPQPPHQRSFDTQLLALDAAALPPAAPLVDEAAALRILLAPAPPDLGPAGSPHLHYALPPPQQQQQQQQPGSAPAAALAALQQAAALLLAGEAVAMPTETVYGLAGNALSPSAVSTVFRAKGRPADNPLIVHISSLRMLQQLYAAGSGSSCEQLPPIEAVLPQQYHRLVAAFWPGPLTLLLPASPRVAAAVTAGHATMAVRMPAHPVARALIEAAGVPLAAPSANRSGRPSPTCAQHVLQDLGGCVPAVLDGGSCDCGVESTVLDGLRVPPAVLRPGGVPAELLARAPGMDGLQVYSRDFREAALEAAPTTPGMKYRHYSPAAPLLLLDPVPAWTQQQQQQQQAGGAEQEGSEVLQQLVVCATQRLVQDLQQQQQQQQLQECHGSAAAALARRHRLVLLTTCGSDGSGAGWTTASRAALAQLQQQQQQQAPVLPGSGGEVLEFVLGSWQRPELVAQQLFGALRAADEAGADVIVAQGLPPVGAGAAVMNRLAKAAASSVPVTWDEGC